MFTVLQILSVMNLQFHVFDCLTVVETFTHCVYDNEIVAGDCGCLLSHTLCAEVCIIVGARLVMTLNNIFAHICPETGRTWSKLGRGMAVGNK